MYKLYTNKCPICDKNKYTKLRMCTDCFKLHGSTALISDWFLFLEETTREQEYIDKKESYILWDTPNDGIVPFYGKRAGRPEIVKEKYNWIRQLKKENPNLSLRQIAKITNVSFMTVRNVLKSVN